MALDAGAETVRVVPEKRKSEGGISLAVEVRGGAAIAGSVAAGRQPLGVRCVRENKVAEPPRRVATSPASTGVAGKLAAVWRGGVVERRWGRAVADWSNDDGREKRGCHGQGSKL